MSDGARHDEFDLLALVVRRLTHDLASPMGALMTALDLAEAPDPLATAAMESLAARLSLWRALAGTLPDAPVDGPALRRGLAAEAARARGRSLEMPPIEDLPPRLARVVVLLALQGLGLLAGAGRVRAGQEAEGLVVRVEGRLSPGCEGLLRLRPGAPAGESRWAPAALALALWPSLRFEQGPDGFLLSVPRAPSADLR